MEELDIRLSQALKEVEALKKELALVKASRQPETVWLDESLPELEPERSLRRRPRCIEGPSRPTVIVEKIFSHHYRKNSATKQEKLTLKVKLKGFIDSYRPNIDYRRALGMGSERAWEEYLMSNTAGIRCRSVSTLLERYPVLERYLQKDT